MSPQNEYNFNDGEDCNEYNFDDGDHCNDFNNVAGDDNPPSLSFPVASIR